jgi:hypothetical protein
VERSPDLARATAKSDTHHAPDGGDGFRKELNPSLQFCPTGKSDLLPHWGVSSPLCKNILIFRRPKSPLYLSPSHPDRGALRNVNSAGRAAVDAEGASDGGA